VLFAFVVLDLVLSVLSLEIFSQMTFLYRLGRKALTQSISQLF